MNLFKLGSLDTLFFRDGKPFSMGDDTWADGIFPPPPSVIYGALRTAYLSKNISEFKNVNTDEDKTAKMKISFLSYYLKSKFYFPCPLDIVKDKANDNSKYYLLRLKPKSDSFFLNFDLPYILKSEGEVEEADGLIEKIALSDYLLHCKPPKSLLEKSKHFLEEPKVGIGRNNETHIGEDGMLYRVGMKRLYDNFGLVVGINDLTLSEEGIMRLGGEGKSVVFSSKTADKPIEPPIFKLPEKLSGDYFKVYLSTPAIFKDGWQPSHDIVGGAELIAAAVGKPIHVGGFDMKPKNGKKPRPKPMRRAVPAGSVYYYKGTLDQAKQIHLNPISDDAQDCLQGFGIALIGDIKTSL